MRGQSTMCKISSLSPLSKAALLFRSTCTTTAEVSRVVEATTGVRARLQARAPGTVQDSPRIGEAAGVAQLAAPAREQRKSKNQPHVISCATSGAR